jgi:hypothetical protein
MPATEKGLLDRLRAMPATEKGLLDRLLTVLG